MTIQTQTLFSSLNSFPYKRPVSNNIHTPPVSSDINNEEQTSRSDGSWLERITSPIRNGFNKFLSNGKDLLKRFKDWFVSQIGGWSNPNEDVPRNGNCGFTSLAMVYKMFGGKCEPGKMNNFIEHLRKLCGASSNEYTGSTMNLLARGAKKLGLDAKSGTRSIDQIEQGLKENKKYILSIDPGALYTNCGHGSHAVALVGIDRARGVALIGDPGDTKGPREVPLSRLSQAMAKSNNYVLEVSNPRNRTLAEAA